MCIRMHACQTCACVHACRQAGKHTVSLVHAILAAVTRVHIHIHTHTHICSRCEHTVPLRGWRHCWYASNSSPYIATRQKPWKEPWCSRWPGTWCAGRYGMRLVYAHPCAMWMHVCMAWPRVLARESQAWPPARLHAIWLFNKTTPVQPGCMRVIGGPQQRYKP